jgi:hypothetical protein
VLDEYHFQAHSTRKKTIDNTSVAQPKGKRL